MARSGSFPPRVLVFNPSGEEELGALWPPLRRAGAQVDEVVHAAIAELFVPPGEVSPSERVVPALPRSSEGYECLIILGGPLGVLTVPPGTEEDQSPEAMTREAEALIRAFHDSGKPVLGICLGSQLVARTFGASVYGLPKDAAHTAMPVQLEDRRPAGHEFGWHAQHFTEAARDDPVIGPAIRAWRAAAGGAPAGSDPHFCQWHSDTFDFPTGATPLSSRPTCTNQVRSWVRNGDTSDIAANLCASPTTHCCVL